MSEATGGVEVKVQSQLQKIIEDLQAIQKASAGVSAEMKAMGGGVGKEIDEQNKKVKRGLEDTKSFGRRVADQLRQDFKSLFAVQSLTAGMKLSDQFSGAIKESVALSDAVRKFSSVFGIAGKDFVHFQNMMIMGLGDIGAGSESAANALKGLAETPVRGEKNLLAYSKTAAQLGSISGEKGQEGAIAKGISGVIQARGGNPNDTAQLAGVSQEILQIRKATGKSATEIVSMLTELYTRTNSDYQKQMTGGGSTTLATAALMGGPQATSFIEKFMGMNRIERKGLEAQGFKDILGKNGELNTKAILQTLQEAKARGLGDAQAGLKTYGFGDEEAKGFIRLAEAVKASAGAINGAKDSVVDINDEYRRTMSLGDSFRANINKVKSVFAPLISAGTSGLSTGMSAASQSGVGAVAVTGSAAILAAVLTGGGLRGVGKGLMGSLGGEAKAAAVEAATGEHVQRVEVINWPAGMGGIGGIAGKAAGGLALGTGAILGAGALATAAGAVLAAPHAAAEFTKAESKGTHTSMDVSTGERGAFQGGSALQAMLVNFLKGKESTQDVRVKVELNKRELRATPLPGRGGNN